MRWSINHVMRRRELLHAIERRDPDRFKPSPYGSGYLTRYQRYTELWRELDRRLANAKIEPKW